MATGRRFALIAATAALAAGSLAVAGCGGGGSGGGSDLSGNILIDGSSTVAPLTSAAAEGFAADNSGVNITVGTSGTGGGFERFCAGETDISDASRAIKDDEKTACADKGIEYEELRVASDGITLVTKKGVDVGTTDLTLAQLKAIWSPGSTIKNWKDVPGGTFKDLRMTLAGPGSQSGTYDFFNEAVLGKDAAGQVIASRQDYSASEDDNVTVRAVEGATAGLGYFGFSYFEENMDALQDFSVDGVAPSPETITNGSYPLSRPLFIYVKKDALARPEVAAFVRYYLENAIQLAADNQFVEAPQAALDEALSRVPA
ncbi:MAG: phosphate transport system substrate-binding protein, partial [Miltoncostaeaceae bacterium]|nr:phosphate transport system substrate-binding protein [Miltoncostaeaceae bacterium]